MHQRLSGAYRWQRDLQRNRVRPSCPTSAPQNCDGTCIAQTAPCAGKCLGGQKYCPTSNTCINSSGCCSPADCSAGGANTIATCTNNTCGIACSSASYSMCGTSCTDLNSDPNNCRTCGSKCGTSIPKCMSGSCVQCLTTVDCSGNKVCSSNQCICPNTDSACGAGCTACSGSTPRCSAGSCVQCLTTADCAGNKVCSGNQCVAPLACGDVLPAVSFPTVLVASGTPPTPAGGAITEGMYALTNVTYYSSSYSSVPGDSFQLQNGAFHLRHTTYSTTGSAMTGYEELGRMRLQAPRWLSTWRCAEHQIPPKRCGNTQHRQPRSKRSPDPRPILALRPSLCSNDRPSERERAIDGIDVATTAVR